MEGPPAHDCCSICMARFEVPCQANCSHWFCDYLLVPGEASLRDRHKPAVAEILENIEKYNRIFGGQTNGLIQRLLRELIDPRRSLPPVLRARVFLAMFLSAFYVLSPIDIIPEAILGVIGLHDDVLIVLVWFLYVAALYRSVLYYRHGGS